MRARRCLYRASLPSLGYASLRIGTLSYIWLSCMKLAKLLVLGASSERSAPQEVAGGAAASGYDEQTITRRLSMPGVVESQE